MCVCENGSFELELKAPEQRMFGLFKQVNLAETLQCTSMTSEDTLHLIYLDVAFRMMFVVSIQLDCLVNVNHRCSWCVSIDGLITAASNPCSVHSLGRG